MNDQELFGDEHVRVYRESGGERGYKWKEGTDILLLTTKAVSYTHLTLPTTPYV